MPQWFNISLKTNLLERVPILRWEKNCVHFFTEFSADARSEKPMQNTLVHRFYDLVVTHTGLRGVICRRLGYLINKKYFFHLKNDHFTPRILP